jgi:hypothetical protein
MFFAATDQINTDLQCAVGVFVSNLPGQTRSHRAQYFSAVRLNSSTDTGKDTIGHGG